MIESNRASGSEKLEPQPLLRDVLAESTFKPGRLIPAHVDSLDLGVFHEIAMQLANACFLNDGNTDLGKLIYVTGKKKVLVPTFFFRANETGVLFMLSPIFGVSKDVAEREQSDTRFLSMSIHTAHNTDLPFFATDFCMLMLPDSDPGASVTSFIAGRTKNMLFFRGQNTPQLALEDIEKKTKLWEWQLRERISQFAGPGMSREEGESIVSKAQNALLGQICKKYDLRFFSGETDKAIVVKQTP